MRRAILQGILRSGRAARRDGLSFFENPLAAEPMGNTVSALLEWNDRALAWAAGWLEADAGRDKALQRMHCLRMW